MGEHELSTMLREAEPVTGHRPPDVDALWMSGRRRTRRARATWGVSLAAAVVLVVGAVALLGRADTTSVQVADSGVGGGPTSVAEGPATSTPEPTFDPGVTVMQPEPGSTWSERATVATNPALPVSLRLDRTAFTVGGDPQAEAGFVPADPGAFDDVTVAIPFTIEGSDGAGGYEPVIDLYDMSGPGTTRASWQPHATGPAWYEYTAGAWGFPLHIPTQDLPPGTYKVCAQAWRTEDGAPRPTDGAEPPSAPTLPKLAIPDSAVKLCLPIHLAAADSEVGGGTLTPESTLEIDRLGLLVALRDTGSSDLASGPILVPGTVRPGQRGLAVLVGHRTTWTAPFRDLDDLALGDHIVVSTMADDGTGHRYTYQVTASRTVPAAGPVEAPTFGIPDSELVDPHDPEPRLRLVTMAPEYSDDERLIVDAVLVSVGVGW